MEEKLSVKLFGSFSAEYGDTVLTFGNQTDSKFRQLFQILMTRPGEDFGKQAIIESIYEPGEVEDPNASLNNTIFRLRRYLRNSVLPSGEYLTIRSGVIRFSGPVEVDSDVWNFELLADEFEREEDSGKKEDLCRRAAELYRGEFLIQLSNEPWVIQKNRYYSKRYFGMLRYLLERLRERGDYAGIERLAGDASRLELFGEWPIWQIESMIAQGRHEEALRTYQDTMERMQELGGSSSREFAARFRELGRKLQTPDGTLESVYRYLKEDVPCQGAYSCTLPSFIDTYRVMKRLEGRDGFTFLLILCTIQNADGSPLGREKSLKRQREKLQTVFGQELRAGDAYVRFRANQYLLLCAGVEEKDLPEIILRIDTEFQRQCHGRYGIHYRLMDSSSWEE